MLKFASQTLRNPIKTIPKFLQSKVFSTHNENIVKEAVDCAVIGAGIVGIAIARALALEGRDVLATLCVRGREMLYRYCSDRGIPHDQIGKLIVATRTVEIPKLRNLLERGIENGVQGLRMMEGFEATRMEPEGEAENSGATFSYNTTVIGGHIGEDHIYLHIAESKNLEQFEGQSSLEPGLILIPKFVINSAGLNAVPLARRLCGLPGGVIPSSYYARGCYFTLSKTRTPFKHLIYPIPEDGGLGVHVTLDLDGQVKFGPDVEWIDGVDEVSGFLNRRIVKFDYTVNTNRTERFYPEIRKYYPNLKDGSLEPGYAGIRSKLCGPRQPPTDFVIQVVSLCKSITIKYLDLRSEKLIA
ncbi:hypothetical protein ACLOJK_000241 [Asimina triloba]